jgi:predicted membrane protein
MWLILVAGRDSVYSLSKSGALGALSLIIGVLICMLFSFIITKFKDKFNKNE